jgi:hypothetical protein
MFITAMDIQQYLYECFANLPNFQQLEWCMPYLFRHVHTCE